MALGDPFATTYEGARKSLGTIGEALQQTADAYVKRKQKEATQKADVTKTLISAGLLQPSITGEYEYGGMKFGVRQPYTPETVPAGAKVTKYTVDKHGNLMPTYEVQTPKEIEENLKATEALRAAGYFTDIDQPVTDVKPTPTPDVLTDITGLTQPTTETSEEVEKHIQDFRGGLLAQERRAKISEKEAFAKVDAKKEVFKLSEKARVNFGRAMAMYSGVIAQIKGAEIEQGGLGLTPGLKGQFLAGIKRPGYGRVSAAYGQTAETALSMNSILTGQNRVIRGVVAMIFKSLPGGLDPEDQVAGKVSQSIRNAYKITKAWEKGGLTEKELAKLPTIKMQVGDRVVDAVDIPENRISEMMTLYKLTPQEERELEIIIEDILSTPPAPARKLGRGIKAPAGKVRVINPNGKAGFIAEERLEEALKRGYTRG